MAHFCKRTVSDLLKTCDSATTKVQKGRALEDLICYVFKQVPGIAFASRNSINFCRSEEIDLAFWNERSRRGFYFLPNIILVECKNWSAPVGSQEVDWFISKIRRHGQDFGILIAMNGVTGTPKELSSAHHIVATALTEKIRTVVISRHEMQQLFSTEQLVRLIKEKLCELAVRGTMYSQKSK